MLIFFSRKEKDDDDEDDDDDNDEDEDDDNVAHRWHRLDGIITDLVIISTRWNEMKHEWPYDEFRDETEGAATHACLAEWQCVCAPASQDLPKG